MNLLERLAVDSSIAVYVFTNSDVTEVAFLPLRPCLSEDEAYVRTAGRGLTRGLGVIGLVGGESRTALTEELPPEQVAALAQAFAEYVFVVLTGSFERRAAGDFSKFAERLWSLDDPRPPEA